ncbi:hypothetical protein [Agrococcus jejuensis]|uniref:hypothetical protein n=1 Tax=Agrococcus jejuensis TaxID=399736 RepID=UPI0011A755F4|nr:hypothetical protein [Agrococcus jejuensis]
MGFEVFDKRMAPLAKAPSITIQKKGIFSINRAAHKLIGEPETVELLFDKDAKIIAMKPSSESHAYNIRPQASSSENGQMILSASAFTQFYDVDTEVSRRYKPYEQDGMLCIDLRGPSVAVKGNRTKQKDPADDS